MSQTSIIINSTDTNNKALQKTLTDANASCSAGVLATFGQMLTGLTTNTYKSTNRVNKLNCDTEDIPTDGGSSTGKPVPTLTVTDDGGGSLGVIDYSGNGSLVAYSSRGACTIAGGKVSAPMGTSNVSGIICASETAEYASTWSTFTLTGGTT